MPTLTGHVCANSGDTISAARQWAISSSICFPNMPGSEPSPTGCLGIFSYTSCQAPPGLIASDTSSMNSFILLASSSSSASICSIPMSHPMCLATIRLNTSSGSLKSLLTGILFNRSPYFSTASRAGDIKCPPCARAWNHSLVLSAISAPRSRKISGTTFRLSIPITRKSERVLTLSIKASFSPDSIASAMPILATER